jgi:hypothetical protein
MNQRSIIIIYKYLNCIKRVCFIEGEGKTKKMFQLQWIDWNLWICWFSLGGLPIFLGLFNMNNNVVIKCSMDKSHCPFLFYLTKRISTNIIPFFSKEDIWLNIACFGTLILVTHIYFWIFIRYIDCKVQNFIWKSYKTWI